MARYEYAEGTSNKFWEIEVSGTDVTTRWGKVGTAGQSKTKSAATVQAALKEHDKLIAEKTAKGYRMVGGAQATSAMDAHEPATALVAPSVVVNGAPTGGTPPAWTPSSVPSVSLADFPVRAEVTTDVRSLQRLTDALAIALALPAGVSLQHLTGMASGALRPEGPLRAGLRVVGTKTRAGYPPGEKWEHLQVSWIAVTEQDVPALWSSDLTVEMPGPPPELALRDASGAHLPITPEVRARLAAAGLVKKRRTTPVLVAEGPLYRVALTPRGDVCASTDETGALTLWSTQTGLALARKKISTPGWLPLGLAFSPDGQTLAAGARRIQFFDASTLDLVRTIPLPGDAQIRKIAWSSDGSLLAVAIGGLGGKKNVRVYRNDEELIFNHADPRCVAFAPDGSHIVVSGFGPTTRYDLATRTSTGTGVTEVPGGMLWLGTRWGALAERDEGVVTLLDTNLVPVGTFTIVRAGRLGGMAIDGAPSQLVLAGASDVIVVSPVDGTERVRIQLPIVDNVRLAPRSIAISADGETIAATSGYAIAVADNQGVLRVTPHPG